MKHLLTILIMAVMFQPVTTVKKRIAPPKNLTVTPSATAVYNNTKQPESWNKQQIKKEQQLKALRGK